MVKGTQQTIGWSAIILGILVAINEASAWPSRLQYLWGILVIILGFWIIGIKK